MHHVLAEDSAGDNMGVEAACADAQGEEDDTCIDRPQEELQVAHDVDHVEPVGEEVGVDMGKLLRLVSVVYTVDALMDDVRREEVEGAQKLLDCKDQ